MSAANVGGRLTLAQYETRASAANQFLGKEGARSQLRYGFFGEVGGLLAAVKKVNRDDVGQIEREVAKEELGDALWYFTILVLDANLRLHDVGHNALMQLQHQLEVTSPLAPSTTLSFYEIDGLLAFRGNQLPSAKDALLYALAAHTGTVFAKTGAAEEDLASMTAMDMLANLFCDLTKIAANFGLHMEDVATSNLNKIESRWRPQTASYIDLFDVSAPSHEQLPRKLEMTFIERQHGNKQFVVQQLNGVNIGDRLTDNRSQPDGYRFHDVFHLAYMAHLGWSPVIRALLKLKRKYDPEIDENQDGARAIIIEEGIATWIFNHASKRDYYEGVIPGKLEYSLLKQAHSMVLGYEPEDCPLWQWEMAIIEGFSVFRQLKDAGGGTVKVDMLKHEITFEALVEGKE